MQTKTITVYSKVCLPCVMKAQEWHDFQQAIWKAGYDFKVVRTTYDTAAHKEASQLWGNENYIAFVIAPNVEALTLERAKQMFEGMKDKRVKAGKTKPVRKGNKNVPRLRKTERSIRVDSVEDTPSEIKVETKTR